MILTDINVLVYAHRSDSPKHDKALSILNEMVNGFQPFAVCSFVLSGFLRLVTNHRIFVEPTKQNQALEFTTTLISLPQCRRIEPGEGYWKIFCELLKKTGATANLISDAYLAAIAMEHGCEVLTFDSDFLKFKGLNVRKMD